MLKMIIILSSLAAPYLISILTSYLLLKDYGGYNNGTYDRAVNMILILSSTMVVITGFTYDAIRYKLKSSSYKSAIGYVGASLIISVITVIWLLGIDFPENYS